MKRWMAVLWLALVAACGGVGAKSPERGEEALPWPAINTPALVEKEGAKDAAVIVAIEHYANVPQIPGATQNGSDWYNFLIESRQIPVERVNLLANDQGDETAIMKALHKAAAELVEGGTLWFIFIGHGAALPFDGKNEGVLVGQDAKQTVDGLTKRSVRQSEILKLMGTSKAAHKLALIDACFSGKSAAGSLVKGLQPMLVVSSAAALGTVTLLSAGAGHEFAGSLPGGNRPAFSYLVLGAMRGWANEAGVVTAKSAVAYAKRSLTAMASNMGRTQTPERTGEDMPLAHGAKEQGPDLAKMLSDAALASAALASAGKVPKFGEGLGSVTDVPSVGGLPEMRAPGGLSSADLKLLRVVQTAKRADTDETLSPEEKAAAWDGVARYEGENPNRRAAEARREQWKKVGAAEQERRKQMAKVWARHGEDDAKLSQLLKFDDSVVTQEEKSQYKDEFAKTYAPWEKELKECSCLASMGLIAEGQIMIGTHIQLATHCTRVAIDALCATEVGNNEVKFAALCMDKTDVPKQSTLLRRIAGITAVSASAVAFGVTAGFGGMAIQRKNAAEPHCPNGNRCDQEGVDLRASSLTASYVATGMFVGGVALAAVGVALIVTAPSGSKDATTSASVVLGPSGVMVRGAW